jgi:hypothetical protein
MVNGGVSPVDALAESSGRYPPARAQTWHGVSPVDALAESSASAQATVQGISPQAVVLRGLL